MHSSATGFSGPRGGEQGKATRGLSTLLMLNCPSKRQPAPLFSGIFMELSMCPTSCLPISSWMSSPTTVGGKGRRESQNPRERSEGPLFSGPLLHLFHGQAGPGPPGGS